MSALFKLLLISALFDSFLWIMLTPFFQYPDEQAHFAQVQNIAELGHVPTIGNDTSAEVAYAEQIVGTQRDGAGNNKYTYHPQYKTTYTGSIFGPQENELSNLPVESRKELVKKESTLNPPLYYSIAAVVYKIFQSSDIFTRVYAIRIFSLLIFLLTLTLTFKIGNLIFKDTKLALTLTSLATFLPMLAYSTSGILPDTLNIFLFTAVIYLCLNIMDKGIALSRIILLILLVCAGAMTRQNFLITLLIIPIPIALEFIEKKKYRKTTFISLVVFAAAVYILSYFVPSLDFIRRFDYPESSRRVTNSLSDLTFIEHLTWTIKHSVAEVWPWFWGIYKWLSLSLPPVVYQIINRLIFFAVLGFVLKVVDIIKNRDYKSAKTFFFLVSSLFIYFFLLATFDYLFRRNNGYSFGIQGRYYFPMIVPFLAMILTGFWQLFKSLKDKAKFALAGLILLFMIFNLVSLMHTAFSNFDTSSIKNFVNHASNYKPCLLKGNILLVVFAASVIFQLLFLVSFVTTNEKTTIIKK